MQFGSLSGLVSGTESIVFDYTVEGSAVSSISTGNILNGDEDGWYTIIVFGVANGNPTYCNLQFNADSGTNYGIRGINANNTTVSNENRTGETIMYWGGISPLYTDRVFFYVGKVYAKSGAVRLVNTIKCADLTGTTVTDLAVCGGVWNNTVDNLVSITVNAAMKVGSRVIILKSNNFTNGTPTGSITTPYIKGAWVRVGTPSVGTTPGSIILPSAASSVTFSGLDGDRDVVYYATSQVKQGTSNLGASGFRINNDSADTYGYQLIYADNTTVGALRNTSNIGYHTGYLLNNGYVSSGYMILFAKQGFIRPGLSVENMNINGTTIGQIRVNGWSYPKTNTNITSLVFVTAANMEAGTQVDLYALRPNG